MRTRKLTRNYLTGCLKLLEHGKSMNVRNNEETDKKMVERILNYIIREVK